jgi:asparagine synthase (glutamine-hydrolysing)
MCGIVGFSGRFSRVDLERATLRLRHRGPDDQGLFVDSAAAVGLGHRRLSILDLSSAGHQPMAHAPTGVTLVYNGELYNFRELRAELEPTGYRFVSQSDTEVVLAAYLTHGTAMLGKMNGIFAFAIWDPRVGRLFVARDALGVKPLYFAHTEPGVSFSSEIKSLLRLGSVSREIDAAAINRYLTFLWCPGDGTPLRDVRKLGPGEYMWLENGRIVERRRWYTLPSFEERSLRISDAEAIEGTAAHLRRAVQRQMVADVPVGAFLSGGVDSSAIVAFARELQPSLQCFTIRNDGGQGDGFVDDLPYARRVAAHLGVGLHVVDVDARSVSDDLQRMVSDLDEPLVDTAPLNTFYISRLARENGIKVLLSGAAGDDVFSGYRRHTALTFERYWSWLPQGARALLERAGTRLDRRRALGRRLAKLLSGFALDGDCRIAHYFVWSAQSDLDALYAPQFRTAVRASGESAVEPMLGFLSGMRASATPLERMLALEQRFFLADFNLLFVDKMSMAVGVEARVPFLDLDLLEFAAGLPDRAKQRGAEGKWVLKKALEPYLPRDVLYRPKTGFGGPVRRWVRSELRQLVGDVLSEERVRRRGLFDPSAIDALRRANDEGTVDASFTLLTLLCLELWCASYVDGEGA